MRDLLPISPDTWLRSPPNPVPPTRVVPNLVAGDAQKEPESSHLHPKLRTMPLLPGGAEQGFFKMSSPLRVALTSAL